MALLALLAFLALLVFLARARSSSATGERDSEKSASMRAFEAGRASSPMEVLRAVEGNTEDADDSVAARRGSKASRNSRTSGR